MQKRIFIIFNIKKYIYLLYFTIAILYYELVALQQPKVVLCVTLKPGAQTHFPVTLWQSAPF